MLPPYAPEEKPTIVREPSDSEPTPKSRHKEDPHKIRTPRKEDVCPIWYCRSTRFDFQQKQSLLKGFVRSDITPDVHCTIKKEDGEVLCENIEVSFEPEINPVLGTRGRRFGDLDLPESCWLLSDNYILLLEDGREGGIYVLPFDVLNTTTTRRRFQVQGDWL